MFRPFAAMLFLVVSASSMFSASVVERDVHSFATPEHIRVRHVDLNIEADFVARVLRGTATLKVERTSKDPTQPLVLDTRELAIDSVEESRDGQKFVKTRFTLGKSDPALGQALTIQVPKSVVAVRVTYSTGPNAAACGPPMRSSGCTRSSSAGSKPKP